MIACRQGTVRSIAVVLRHIDPAGSDHRLSVVIPCHNVALYVADTVRSLQRNVGDGVEFVFVDDASTDETAAVLEHLLADLPDSRLITHDHNHGLSGARNTGIDHAAGRWITFLDGDDLVAPGYYRRLVEATEGLGVDFVRTDHVRFSGVQRVIDRVPFGPRHRPADPRTGILPVDRNTAVDYPYAWAGIYHRRLADRGLLHFDPRLRTCEDRPWIWRLHRQAESFAVVGLLGLFYRRSLATSLSQVADDRQFDFIPAFERILAEAAADPDADLLLPKAMRTFCAIMVHQLSRLDRYPAPAAAVLTHRCRQALQDLPGDQLRTALTGLDARRRQTLRRLIEAA